MGRQLLERTTLLARIIHRALARHALHSPRIARYDTGIMRRPVETSVARTLPFSSDAGLRRSFLLTDEPLKANFRFGLLLETLDTIAEQTALAYVAQSHPEARFVTAAIDSIRIRNAPDVSRDMHLLARVNYVGRTSLEVGVRVEQAGDDGPHHLASCYFTMVARSGTGDDAQSIELPPLHYEDEYELRRERRAVDRRARYRDSQSEAVEPPTREEYALLQSLHAAQDRPDFSGALARDLVTSGYDLTYPEHENVPKKIFGGYVIHRAFMYSSICAELIAPDRPTIVAVNRINFHHPVRIADKLHFTSRVTYTGSSSVSVETDIVRISRDRTSTSLCNTCIFTFTNVDAELRRRFVPPVYPTTYAEDARYLAANRRHIAHQTIVNELRSA
jgi:acyl-coenzyme A thioesterase 9